MSQRLSRQLLRRLLSLTIHEALAVTLPPPETIIAGSKALSQQVAPVTHWEPCLSPAHPTLTVRGDFSGQSLRCLIPQNNLIHSTVAQKQPDLVPLRRILNKGTPVLLHPHSPSELKSHSSSWVLSSCCVSQTPFTWLAALVPAGCSLLFKRLALHSSPFTLLANTRLGALCCAKGQQFTASPLEFPPRAQSASQSATCQPSYPYQMYSSTHFSKVLLFCHSGHLSHLTPHQPRLLGLTCNTMAHTEVWMQREVCQIK